MNEVFESKDVSELWSLPWHALQRSLASGTGTAPGTPNPAYGNPRLAAVASGNWLVRARRLATQVPVQADAPG